MEEWRLLWTNGFDMSISSQYSSNRSIPRSVLHPEDDRLGSFRMTFLTQKFSESRVPPVAYPLNEAVSTPRLNQASWTSSAPKWRRMKRSSRLFSRCNVRIWISGHVSWLSVHDQHKDHSHIAKQRTEHLRKYFAFYSAYVSLALESLTL